VGSGTVVVLGVAAGVRDDVLGGCAREELRGGAVMRTGSVTGGASVTVGPVGMGGIGLSLVE